MCRSFPLNSRCKGFQAPQVQDATVDDQNVEVIKLRLKTSGSRSSLSEWIRIEVNGNTVKLLHTTKAVSSFSRLTNNLLRIVSPITLPNFYNWYDHPPYRVVFKPDVCSDNSAFRFLQLKGYSSCTITGIDTVILAKEMDIRRGVLTIEYKESDLLRSITLRIPAEQS